ncbi:hypothetical protein [Arthrobacter mangrovi]|uniref:Uncharacterized protein n=1 Tax=Arthrobacter mangrovi TaxID=2966350 RepID=A0ABQ5MYK5_9MICC|nr:hypothetical protein [Arthrobacter mangrovi]GLB69067.1 hypothetical protein AHIS1636_35100 [Arthrobacter mangrovi]
MTKAIDQEAILAAARDIMVRPVGGDTLNLISLRVVDGYLEVVFRWNERPEQFGYRVELPDTTDHPSWTKWAPQTVEEWVEYAVRFSLIEDMQTGLLPYGRRRFDGSVLWLEGAPS